MLTKGWRREIRINGEINRRKKGQRKWKVRKRGLTKLKKQEVRKRELTKLKKQEVRRQR